MRYTLDPWASAMGESRGIAFSYYLDYFVGTVDAAFSLSVLSG